VNHLCCTHLRGVRGSWRVIFGFPGDGEIAILAIGRHDQRAARNVYDELYGALGLARPPAGRRTKPPCCDEEPKGEVDPALFDRARELMT
jgi:hypothetical protein